MQVSPRVRSEDALFVDRLLNRGGSADDVARIAADAGVRLPRGYVDARVAERAEQRAIRDALPPGIEQRTPEWYAARENFVTASDFYAAAWGTDAAKKRFVAAKTGSGAPFTGSDATRWGVKYEEVARLLYQHDQGCEVAEYGLLPHPSVDIMAASPDGVSDCGVAFEAKCPTSRTLTEVPPEYFAQMQGQMDVAGLRYCDFVVCRARELEADDFWPAFRAAHDAGYGHERYGAVRTTPGGEFEYSAPGASPDELQAWIAASPESVALHHVHDFRVTRVTHDPEYVADMVARLRETWETVVATRSGKLPPPSPQAVSGVLRGFSFKHF